MGKGRGSVLEFVSFWETIGVEAPDTQNPGQVVSRLGPVIGCLHLPKRI